MKLEQIKIFEWKRCLDLFGLDYHHFSGVRILIQ